MPGVLSKLITGDLLDSLKQFLPASLTSIAAQIYSAESGWFDDTLERLSHLNTFSFLNQFFAAIKELSKSKVFKWVTLVKVLLFITLCAPTSGKHLLYYGWLLRVISGIAGVYFLGVNYSEYKHFYFLAIGIFYLIRIIQRHFILREQAKQGRLITSLSSLESVVLKDMPYPVSTHALEVLSGNDSQAESVKMNYTMLGRGKKIIMLGNGLGGRWLTYNCVLNLLRTRNLYDEFTVVSWEYRGLFQSSLPTNPARLSIRDLTDDVLAIMKAIQGENYCIHTFIGWSTGVQVALEFAALYPSRVNKIILLNGTHGQALSSCFQPILRVPWFGYLMHDCISFIRSKTDHIWDVLADFLRQNETMARLIYRPYSLLYNEPDIEWFLTQYINDIFGVSASHTKAYLRLFQSLEAHSVQHLLLDINTPTLIIAAQLDTLTPAYQSYEMGKQLKNSTLINYSWGTHFLLMEYPQEVSKNVVDFIQDRTQDQVYDDFQLNLKKLKASSDRINGKLALTPRPIGNGQAVVKDAAVPVGAS
jgi:pimeloyl-ACP methyl ester carboxylesterase